MDHPIDEVLRRLELQGIELFPHAVAGVSCIRRRVPQASRNIGKSVCGGRVAWPVDAIEIKSGEIDHGISIALRNSHQEKFLSDNVVFGQALTIGIHRTQAVFRIRGVLLDSGLIAAWYQRIACAQSLSRPRPPR